MRHSMSSQPDNDCNCSYQLVHCKSPRSFVSKLPPGRVVECKRPMSGLRYAGSSLWRPASLAEFGVCSIMLNHGEQEQIAQAKHLRVSPDSGTGESQLVQSTVQIHKRLKIPVVMCHSGILETIILSSCQMAARGLHSSGN